MGKDINKKQHCIIKNCYKGKLRALTLPGGYMVPKEYLADWLSSVDYNRIIRKSRTHVDALWEMNDK